MQGRIIKSLGGFYYVESKEKVYQTRARGNFRKKGQKPYVGDQVTFSAENHSEGYILSIEERKNSLVRPPIVNIDQAVIVMSWLEPDFNTNLLDRFLLLLEHRHIKPLIYLTKTDLADQTDKIDRLKEAYLKVGYSILTTVEELKQSIPQQITVFMGQTGVGKSTLINQLDPTLSLETNTISKSLGRGRHTTRAVSLYDVCDGKIADTPGFSSIDYEVDTAEELSRCFIDLNRYHKDCRFRSCTHRHEPDCRVKLAVAEHDIVSSRYDNYLQILSEIENRREVYQKNMKKQN